MQTHRDSMRDRFIPITAWLVAAATFLTVGVSFAQTPDTFTWSGGASGIWNAPGGWTPLATSRTFPEIAGDLVVTTNAATLTLNGNTTVSGISASLGNMTVVPSGVVTQIFASSSASVTNRIHATSATSNPRYIYLGNALVDDNLTLNVADNLIFSGSGGTLAHLFVRGRLIGGTEETPISLIARAHGTEYPTVRVYLMNANNDFRGDVFVGATGSSYESNMFVFLGYSSVNGTDAMLGHPDNKVILLNKRPNLCVSRCDAGGLKRRILGTGNVRGLRIDTGYPTITNPDALFLGDGSSLEPSVAFSNPIGKITVIGSALTTHANSQIRINVTPTTKDVVAFSGTSAFTYTGKVLMEPLETVAPGTSWDIITVTKDTKGFTFSPSYTTPFYSFKATSNATDGWVVTATKQVDTTLFPAVQNLATTLIAETNATIHADVISVAPDGEATLRAYFGTVDQGANVGAWEQAVEYPAAVTEPGVSSLRLDTLQLNQTYYVRHSISNSTGESMSPDVVSFATRPWETPDIFTWVVTNDNWQTLGAWSVDTPYERRIPGFKGDKVIVNVGGSYPNAGINRTLNITNDVAIGAMTINEGYQAQVAVTATNGPATLTFDADATGTNLIYSTAALAGLRFGNNAGDYGLTVELKQPLLFRRNSAWGLNVEFYSAIVGGSGASPTDLFFLTQGDEYCALNPSLLNTNNTFRGDVHLGERQVYAATTMLTIGNAAMPARNEMLGDGANQMILRNKSTLRYHAGAEDSATCERHVVGTGKLSSTKALHLGAGAVLEPLAISRSGYGTITVEASDLTADADARYVLDLSASGEGNDGLVVNVSSPLTLTGRLELVPEADERVAVGTSWDVIQVAPTATSFTSNLKKSPGFILTTTGDAETGWTVTATAAPLASMLIVR